MKVLVDTHCWLWSLREPDRLNPKARRILDSPDTEPILSTASIWEITIKFQIGRLPLPKPPEEYVPEFVALQGVSILPIQPTHVYGTRHLPLLHRDPFDRLLVAQALAERIAIVTADPAIRAYRPPLIWAARRSKA